MRNKHHTFKGAASAAPHFLYIGGKHLSLIHIYLIPAVFAEMASATGFYYTKAKAENKIKLMNANGVQPEADNFNDF